MHNLKVENYVLFSRHAEDLSLRDSLLDSSEGLFQRGKGRARIYIGVFANQNQEKQTNKNR